MPDEEHLLPYCTVCCSERSPQYTCNRGICGLPRTIKCDVLYNGEVQQFDAKVHPGVHINLVKGMVITKVTNAA